MANDKMLMGSALGGGATAKAISALLDPSSQDSGIEDILAELGRQVMGAHTQAEQAKGQLGSALASPVPQTDPMMQALMSSLGNAASGLTGSPEPSEHAKSIIETDTKNQQQKRLESIDQLSKAYQRAADRAEKMGDTEMEIKFREKLTKQHETRAALLGMMTNTLESGQADARQARQLAATKELQVSLAQSEGLQKSQLEQLRNTGDERVAYIQQGLDPDDPSKPLTYSKAQRVRTAGSLGFMSSKDWAIRMAKITDESAKKGLLGTVKYDTNRMRNLLLNSLPPDLSYATSPNGYRDVLMGLTDPEDKTGTKPLFPRDSKNPNMPTKVWADRIQAYLNRWYPDYVPGVEDMK